MNTSHSNHLRTLVRLFSSVRGKDQLEALMEDLFTPQEIATFSERVEIFRLLDQGIPHRRIAEQLECGVATVTRGSRAISHGNAIVPELLKQA